MTPDLAERSIEEELTAALADRLAENDGPAIEAVETPSEASETPARDADGKFAAAETTETAEAPETASDAPTDEEQPVIPDRYGVPPTYAKKGIREKWGELPAEVRQELHEREADFHKQLTRNDEERNFGKQIKQVVAPYEGFIKSLGAEPVQAFDYLLKTDYALRTAPPEQRKALFIKAAADYGISFANDEMGQVPASDPRVETLQQQIARLEQAQQSVIQERQLQEQRSIEQQIAEFQADPKHVFFDRVGPMMATLLQSGAADDLNKAYDMAVYADPETRALQLAAERQTEQSQRLKATQAAADKARAASVSVTGAPGLAVPASSPTSAGSLEDDIRHAIAASSNRI